MFLSQRWLAALVAALLLASVFRGQTTSELTVGWYNGERQLGIPGYANWYASSSVNARVYDDFVVPDGGWMVAAVFSNNSFYNAPPVSEACWEIRSGISASESGSLVATGIGQATQTFNANTNDYRIQVNGLKVALAPGRYWLSVAPIGPTGGQSFVSATIGVNAVGDTRRNAAGAFNGDFAPITSTGQGGSSSDFSQGLLISGPAPDAKAPPSSADQWRADIATLISEMPVLYGLPFPGIRKDDWLAKAADLNRRIPSLTDAEIRTGLMSLVASIGDPHTDVAWPSNIQFRVVPLNFYWFDDGIYVTGASAQYPKMLGTKLVSVGTTRIDDAFRRLSSLVPHENDQWLKKRIPQFELPTADYLFGTGLIPSIDKVSMVTQSAAGDIVSSDIPTVLQRQMPRMVLLPTAGPPLYRQHTDRNYWATVIDNGETLYFQYSSCMEDPKQPSADFFAQLKPMMADRHVQRIVLDMRFNSGGFTSILSPWIEEIRQSRFNNKGRLYVIVGRATFSAAMEASNHLHDRTAAIFVGEPTGAKPQFKLRRGDFPLPYYGIRVSYANGTESANLTGPTLIPDIQTGLTFSNYVNGVDPALNAILAIRPMP
jgi:hypothetical protein